MQKRKLLLLALFAIVLSLFSFSTYAYFTAEQKTENKISTGSIQIQLNQWGDLNRQTPFATEIKVLPGQKVTKVVDVENIGSGDCYIRIKVDDVWNGQQSDLNMDYVELVSDSSQWTKQGDYYYYNQKLAVGQTSSPVFTAVIFDEKMDNRYQGATLTLQLYAEAIQAMHTADNAIDAFKVLE